MNLLFWFRKLYCQFKNQAIPKASITVTEEPEIPHSDSIYLIGNPGYIWLAALQCPCGCGAIIKLNLLSDVRPSWKYKQHLDSTVSLYPSIDRIYGCKSHFWVKKGLIKWVIVNFH